MSRGGIDFKVLTFFDRPAVKKQTRDKTREALKLLGARIKRAAKRGMRKRKGPSPVGSPPSKHEKPYLDKFFFYQWDQATQTVVAGPIPLGRGIVPRLHEHGGAAAVRLPSGQTVRAVYRPRPFSSPAAAQELPNLGECYRQAGA